MEPLQIGVCSWSPAIPDLARTLATVKNELGLELVQVGFFGDGNLDTDNIIKTIKAGGIEVSATCVGFEGEDYSSIQAIARTGGFLPDEKWEQRLARTVAVADLTARLGVRLLAGHIGFVPHDTNDPKYAVMVERIRRICSELKRRDLTLVMETGQEKAADLLSFIEAVGCDNIGINFDPANMILYGAGKPLDAVDLLKDWIVHVHAKDATWSDKPGEQWGTEVVLGTGQADIAGIVRKLRNYGYRGPLVIEREWGDNRIGDIKEGIEFLRSAAKQ